MINELTKEKQLSITENAIVSARHKVDDVNDLRMDEYTVSVTAFLLQNIFVEHTRDILIYIKKNHPSLVRQKVKKTLNNLAHELFQYDRQTHYFYHSSGIARDAAEAEATEDYLDDLVNKMNRHIEKERNVLRYTVYDLLKPYNHPHQSLIASLITIDMDLQLSELFLKEQCERLRKRGSNFYERPSIKRNAKFRYALNGLKKALDEAIGIDTSHYLSHSNKDDEFRKISEAANRYVTFVVSDKDLYEHVFKQ